MIKGKVCFILTVVFCASGVLASAKSKVTFVYEPKPGEIISSIAVAGSFNHWNSGKDFLVKQKDGSYAITLELEEGLHLYKFVINGNKWIEDPKADVKLRKEDGFGGYNSGIIVGESGDTYGVAIPDDIVVAALKHDTNDIKYFNLITPSLVEIKLRTLADDVSDVKVVDETGTTTPMKKVRTHIGFDFYSVFIDDIPSDRKFLKYKFIISDGDKELEFPQTGRFVAELKPKFKTPEWAKSAVWYQIMLDRFYDGEPANNDPKALPWGWEFSKVHPSEKGEFYEVVWNRTFGGDLQGLIKKLSYLKELGVSAIYLTPVFEADSPHKYNTVDYRHIDDNFGFRGDIAELKGETDDPKTWRWTKTDKLFLEFLKKAKSEGFRVIIDGVFNHCGENFWAFDDVQKKGKKSKYASWFDITNWDVFMRESHLGRGYRGWAGFGGLPEYREDENGLVKGPKEHIFDITRRWMDPDGDGDPSDGVDGWRLDVPDNVKMPFWIEWCKLVRSINPDAYISGELWYEVPQWLNEKLFHAQMNYPFAKTILNFASNRWLTASKFDSEISRLLSIYPYQVNFVQQNLLDSHDTDRAVSMLYNPGRHYDKGNRLNPVDVGDFNPSYKTEKPPKEVYEQLKFISAIQFTLPGAPMIWYGDEVGMWGSDDPFCREPMVWKELEPYDNKDKVFMDDIFKHYQKLIAIRNTYPELQTGIYTSIYTNDEKEVVVYGRQKGKKIALVALNNSNKTQTVEFGVELEEGKKFFDILSEKNFRIVDAQESDGKYTYTRKKISVSRPSKILRVKNAKLKLSIPQRSVLILLSV